MGERTVGVVTGELLVASGKKAQAIHEQDFALAAACRDDERRLQEEWARLGGPRPGFYRIRLDRPDGSHTVSEAATEADAMEGLGYRDIRPYLELIARAADTITETFQLLRDDRALSSRERR